MVILLKGRERYDGSVHTVPCSQDRCSHLPPQHPLRTLSRWAHARKGFDLYRLYVLEIFSTPFRRKEEEVKIIMK